MIKSNINLEIPENHNKLVKNISNLSSKSFFLCNCQEVFENENDLCEKCNHNPINYFTLPDFTDQLERLSKNVIFDANTFDFAFFTDGVDIYRKSKYCLWPLYMVSTQLPYSQRYKLENIIILGIYYGQMQPDMQLLLKIAFSPLLFYNKFSIKLGNCRKNISLKYIIADKPARSKILNMQSHNSKYFCSLCLKESKTQIFNGTRHVFVTIEDNEYNEPRTNFGFSALAYSASSTEKPDYGIKGRCFFENVTNFNIVNSNILDYMHGVCGGIMKTLFNQLFQTLPASNPLSLKFSKDIDKLICQMKYSPLITKKANETQLHLSLAN